MHMRQVLVKFDATSVRLNFVDYDFHKANYTGAPLVCPQRSKWS